MRKRKRNNRGSTMVEVLAAMMIVVMVAVLFGKTVMMSAEILRKSKDMAAATERFEAEFYREDSNRITVSEDLALAGEGVTIPLSRGSLERFEGEEMSRYTIAGE